MKPRNFEERAVWWAIVGTYGFYLVGGLYILAPVLAWILLIYLGWKLWHQTADTPAEEKITIPWGVYVWVVSMLGMELALIAGHLDTGLGVDLLVKSSLGWAKGWALLALFPLIGCLNIRLQLLSRAACILGLQTLVLLPVFLMAYVLRLPETLYVSPLQAVGGPGAEFFSVDLYEIDPGNGLPRWRLFTPWAPALGFVANIYFFLAASEPEHKWRWTGMAACVAMCLVSGSRLAILAVPIVWGTTRLMTGFAHPGMLVGGGVLAGVAGAFSTSILDAFETIQETFVRARADSSRVREVLGRIAVERWSEAPLWGHGVVERGPHLVEYMPIGSHHTWFGLLFVKGAVGFVALGVPMLWTVVDLLLRVHHSKTARLGMSVFLIIFLYTFGENLEILAYLFWPGLITIGIALKERQPADLRPFSGTRNETESLASAG